jgi:hypothetical protein
VITINKNKVIVKTWMIKKKGGGKSKKEHTDRNIAIYELKRLSELFPTDVFILYESIGYAKVRYGDNKATVRELPINGERGILHDFPISNYIMPTEGNNGQ